MHRRSLLAIPFALAVASPARAASPGGPLHRDWCHTVSELRFGGSGPATAARARSLERTLGVPVRPVRLPPQALAAALNAGHIEFAELAENAAAAVFELMGERVHIAGATAVRNALPAAMHNDLVQALAT